MSTRKYKMLLAVMLALFAWCGTVTATQAATLVLVRLTCHEPEDANWDEPELVVRTGGATTSFKLRSMTRGSTISPIGRVLMGGQAVITLYDRDNGRNDFWDADDYLGAHTIQPVATGREWTLTFNQDGAYYTLRYRVDP